MTAHQAAHTTFISSTLKFACQGRLLHATTSDPTRFKGPVPDQYRAVLQGTEVVSGSHVRVRDTRESAQDVPVGRGCQTAWQGLAAVQAPPPGDT